MLTVRTQATTQPAYTCSESKIETPEQCMKSVQNLQKRHQCHRDVSDTILVFLLLTDLNYDGGLYHIETISLICSSSQWTGFFMIATSVMKELNFNKTLS